MTGNSYTVLVLMEIRVLGERKNDGRPCETKYILTAMLIDQF